MNGHLELQATAAALSRSLQRRLMLWAVRWLLGFAIIAALVHFNPGLSWLWWVSIGIAGLSLTATLVMHLLMQRRIAKAQGRIADFERMAAEAEASNSQV